MDLTRERYALLYRNAKSTQHLCSYMFLRFLKMLIWIFLGFTLLTFAVIVPIDAIGIANTDSNNALERISWTK